LGGNSALSPERAKTFSIGFTTTPSFIDGFTGSVDYFKIDVNNVIVQGIPLAISLNSCLQTGNPTFCSNVVRTSAGWTSTWSAR
jgi:outer membrane receptor protein involved in Fe transport